MKTPKTFPKKHPHKDICKYRFPSDQDLLIKIKQHHGLSFCHIQKLLGHESLKTAEVYTHISKNLLQK